MPTNNFEGFSVLVPGDRKMQCMHYVPSLSVTMGSYTLVDHFFVVDIPNTNVILGVQWLITLGKVTTNWEDLQMEWVEKKSGEPQMIKGMHTYPSHNTSTHKTEMDLRSGSKDLTVPSIMVMIFLQGTLLSSCKPPGRPPNSVLVRDISLHDAPRSELGGMGALEDTTTALGGLGKHKEEGDFFLSSSSPTLISNSVLLEEKKGRYVLPTCIFGIRHVKEEIRNMVDVAVDASSTLSLFGNVDLYCKS